MSDILVLKFGGSVLESGVNISKAAKMVSKVREKGFSPIVIVSALKGMTDTLLELSRNVNPEAPPQMVDEVLAMGERTSARIFTTALQAQGLDPVTIDPESESWPIITDEVYTNASPLDRPTRDRVESRLRPMIDKGMVPVVCGFVGRSESGRITTMGRGGSDTTAVVLGNHLGAKEVILIKDVASVYSGDPDSVRGTVPVEELDSEEAFALASGGAKFLQSKSLKYKAGRVRIRVSSLESNPFSGTVINGDALDLRVELMNEDVSKITIVGARMTDTRTMTDLIGRIRENGGMVLSLSLDPKTATLYVTGGKSMAEHIHSIVIEGQMAKAVSAFEDLVMVNVGGSAMETIPGMIQRVTQPLAHAGVNIYGMATIGSSIRLFITRNDLEKALDMLRKALMINSGTLTKQARGDS